MPHAELSCREFVEFLADHLSGELPAARRKVFTAHVAECRSCGNYVRTYRSAIRIARRALGCDREPVAADIPGELVQAILSAREEGS